jgi:holin-like protein
MLLALFLLLLFQLIGEAISRGFGLPLPGPVIGFVLMALVLFASKEARRQVDPTAAGLLRHLSLLFVPAATGIIREWGLLRAEAVPIVAALLLSTWAALAVTALTFRAVARLARVDEVI